jgi:REP element-mobilizing transposase RayT
MARPLRLQLRNGWYHLTARGNNRQSIYRDERDCRHFLELVEEMIGRHGVEVHAYVLMDNHYHLLVRTPHANLSAAVQWLNTAYGIWWNLRHGRVGHVFQGRFKSVVVDIGKTLLALWVRERVAVKSPVLEYCTPRSVGGAPGNRRPYPDTPNFSAFVARGAAFLNRRGQTRRDNN